MTDALHANVQFTNVNPDLKNKQLIKELYIYYKQLFINDIIIIVLLLILFMV